MAYLGLDIGTTRCKAGIFDSDGQLLVSASREYGYSSPHPGWAEQDPLEVWELAKEILKEVAQKTLPFILMEILALLLITYVEFLPMFLPRLLGFA